MTACLQNQGFRHHAKRRGFDCVTMLEGPQRLDRGSRISATRPSLPTLASRYIGVRSGSGGLPEYAGETFTYAFVGARVGLECRQRKPGLMVAINWCDDEVGRIIPGTSAEH